MKARLSCSPSPLETNSITGGDDAVLGEAAGKLAVHAFIEVVDADAENARDFEQTAGADAVDALFVFLHLLKCQAEQFAQPFLTHADQHAAKANAIAHLGIDGIGLFLWHGLHNAPFEPDHTHTGQAMKTPISRYCSTEYYLRASHQESPAPTSNSRKKPASP